MKVIVKWYQRLWHRIRGLFSPEVRKLTKTESELLRKAARLELAVAERDETLEGLGREVEELKAALRVKDIEIQGMAIIIKRHEQHWEAEVALESRRIADATQPNSR